MHYQNIIKLQNSSPHCGPGLGSGSTHSNDDLRAGHSKSGEMILSNESNLGSSKNLNVGFCNKKTKPSSVFEKIPLLFDWSPN